MAEKHAPSSAEEAQIDLMSIGEMDVLTEAQRNALHEAAAFLTDHGFGNDFDDRLIESLPPRFRPFYTGLFMRSFAVCVATVAWKLFAEGSYRPDSVAEEMALNAIITEAKAIMEMHDQDPGEEWDDYMDTAFEDLDFELLWRDDLDGIEASEIGEQMAIVHLALKDWFKPFANRRVHPYVADYEPGALRANQTKESDQENGLP